MASAKNDNTITTNGDGSISGKAGVITAAIRAVEPQVDGFTVLDSAETKRLTLKNTIDPKFLEAGIIAVNASPKLQAACNLDTNGVRTAIRIDAAYAAPEQEAQTLASGIHGMRLTTYVAAVDQCDHVLAVGLGLLSQPSAGLSVAEKADLATLRKVIKSMQKARKMHRKTSENPKAKPSPKKAARAAKKATTTAQKAAARAQRAAARAEAAAVKATGGVAVTNGKTDGKATTTSP